MRCQGRSLCIHLAVLTPHRVRDELPDSGRDVASWRRHMTRRYIVPGNAPFVNRWPTAIAYTSRWKLSRHRHCERSACREPGRGKAISTLAGGDSFPVALPGTCQKATWCYSGLSASSPRESAKRLMDKCSGRASPMLLGMTGEPDAVFPPKSILYPHRQAGG